MAAYRELYRHNMQLLEVSGKQAAKSFDQTHSGPDDDAKKAEMEEHRIIFDKVRNLIESCNEIFDPDFSLERMAEIAGMKPRLISKAVNEVTGKNFSSLIGELRIREACRMLNNLDMMRTMKVEGVAEAVGYRSRTHFSKVFKDITGLTPSQFIAAVKAESIENGRKEV